MAPLSPEGCRQSLGPLGLRGAQRGPLRRSFRLAGDGETKKGMLDIGNPGERRPPAGLGRRPPLAFFSGAAAPGVGAGGQTGQSIARPGPLGPPAVTSRRGGQAAPPPCRWPIGFPSRPSLGRGQPLCFGLRAAPFGRAGLSHGPLIAPNPARRPRAVRRVGPASWGRLGLPAAPPWAAIPEAVSSLPIRQSSQAPHWSWRAEGRPRLK